MIFLTCNNIDKINSAVKRPGRVDQIYYLTYADDYQVKEMFWRFFGKGDQTTDPEARKEDSYLQKVADVFLSHIRSLNQEFTTATLQKFFLEYEKEQEIEYWKQEKKQDNSNSNSNDSAMGVAINTKDIGDDDEKKQYADTNGQEEEDKDIFDDILMDMNLLTDEKYVKNLFEKIQTETNAEEKMKKKSPRRKKNERKKKK